MPWLKKAPRRRWPARWRRPATGGRSTRAPSTLGIIPWDGGRCRRRMATPARRRTTMLIGRRSPTPRRSPMHPPTLPSAWTPHPLNSWGRRWRTIYGANFYCKCGCSLLIELTIGGTNSSSSWTKKVGLDVSETSERMGRLAAAAMKTERALLKCWVPVGNWVHPRWTAWRSI